jgi:hypothetical protein
VNWLKAKANSAFARQIFPQAALCACPGYRITLYL